MGGVMPYRCTDERRIAVQIMGGVLLGFPSSARLAGKVQRYKQWGRTAVQIGGVLQHFLRDQ